MWRYLVGAGGALLLAIAGMFLFRGSATSDPKIPPAPQAAAAAGEEAPLPDEAPSATARTREQKRFDRVDKDRNDAVSRDEFLALRRRAFAKLDTDGDGKLSFEESSVKAIARFAGADKDKSGTLTRPEFAATAPKPRTAKPRCACGPAKAAPQEAADDSGD